MTDMAQMEAKTDQREEMIEEMGSRGLPEGAAEGRRLANIMLSRGKGEG